MNINCSPKLGIIQAALQTLNEKFQNTKLGTAIYFRTLLCYFLCWSLSVSPCWSYFRPIPALYANIPAFYSKIFPSSATVDCRTRGARMRGGGSHGWRRIVCGFARKIILARNIMCQPEAQCHVLVQLPVPQGTGESSSADHA